MKAEIIRDLMVKDYIMPKKIIWSDKTEGIDNLLIDFTDQPVLICNNPCIINAGGGIILDFGRELNGGIKLIVFNCFGKNNAKVRLRFGESVMECKSEIGEKNSTNDHSIRDAELYVPMLGALEYGNTGFRFVKIDNIDNVAISFVQVKAVFIHRDLEQTGHFICDDDLLNKIYKTGAYTIFLNTQNYVYDGIKRDRHVWIGDMHPEVSAISRLYNYDDCVPKSLDFVRDAYPPHNWMNSIPSYSMWWIKIQYDWYLHQGNKAYLKLQKEYLKKLLDNLIIKINENGSINIENIFLDWPSSTDIKAQDAGVHSLLILSINAAHSIMVALEESSYVLKCEEALIKLKRYIPDHNNNKHSAALMVLAETLEPIKTNKEVLKIDPVKGISTFLSYYVLQARAMAGDINGALSLIKEYFGAMIDLGATTFWEDFNIEWVEGAKPLDTLLKDNEYDIHGDNGAYCYKGFRHSLCHGWSSGFVSFLSEYILGVKVLEPGCKKIKFSPNLGNLQWAEGTVPTPYGIIKVRLKKEANGNIIKEICVPEEIEVLQELEISL